MIGKNSELLHAINHLAFWLATVHGHLIGTNVQNSAMRVAFGLGLLVQQRMRICRRRWCWREERFHGANVTWETLASSGGSGSTAASGERSSNRAGRL